MRAREREGGREGKGMGFEKAIGADSWTACPFYVFVRVRQQHRGAQRARWPHPAPLTPYSKPPYDALSRWTLRARFALEERQCATCSLAHPCSSSALAGACTEDGTLTDAPAVEPHRPQGRCEQAEPALAKADRRGEPRHASPRAAIECTAPHWTDFAACGGREMQTQRRCSARSCTTCTRRSRARRTTWTPTAPTRRPRTRMRPPLPGLDPTPVSAPGPLHACPCDPCFHAVDRLRAAAGW